LIDWKKKNPLTDIIITITPFNYVFFFVFSFNLILICLFNNFPTQYLSLINSFVHETNASVKFKPLYSFSILFLWDFIFKLNYEFHKIEVFQDFLIIFFNMIVESSWKYLIIFVLSRQWSRKKMLIYFSSESVCAWSWDKKPQHHLSK
jgi:hypothetical protein